MSDFLWSESQRSVIKGLLRKKRFCGQIVAAAIFRLHSRLLQESKKKEIQDINALKKPSGNQDTWLTKGS